MLSTTVREHQNAVSPIKPTNTEDINETVVKNIQNKLESNGFTIKRIKVVPSAYSNAELNSATDPIETNVNLVSCKHCKEKFSNLKILAQHQLIHLKLNVNKIFQKHLLPKHLRRGRLITLNDNKCIRCLNCWRIHKDNKAILQHWSVGECEFYCFVCGKEFPHSPKLLRDHITEVHGVSYRSIKSELTTIKTQNVKPISVEETKMHSFEPHSAAINLNPTVVKKVYKKPPPKVSNKKQKKILILIPDQISLQSCTKNADGTITCKICHKVFDNFRSSNSHMRKHKPPTRIGDAFVGLSVATDKYHTADDYGLHPSTSKTYYNNASLSNSQHIKPPRPPYRVIMTNGGIKTKIVQKRHDFLSNYEAHNSRPAQRPMASSPDIDDDENLIVPELLTTAIKSEHSPTIDTQNNGRNGLKYAEYESNPLKPTIKSEPLDNTDYGVTKETHFCFICNESFATSRDYQLHAMFVHNIN